jgi:hypothetical protein
MIKADHGILYTTAKRQISRYSFLFCTLYFVYEDVEFNAFFSCISLWVCELLRWPTVTYLIVENLYSGAPSLFILFTESVMNSES